MTNRQIHIVELPKGKLGPEHFRLAEGAMPQPKEGELLLRTRLISLDAANRAWMQGATYRAAIEAGQVMAGGAVAEVIEARAPGFAAGDLVFADTGWQDYAALPARHCQKQPRVEPMSHLLSVYGVAGQRQLVRREGKQEEEALLNEMEVTGQAFEDMQEQNSRLIQQLREKDDANFKLMSERIKAQQVHKLQREEKDMLVEQVGLKIYVEF